MFTNLSWKVNFKYDKILKIKIKIKRLLILYLWVGIKYSKIIPRIHIKYINIVYDVKFSVGYNHGLLVFKLRTNVCRRGGAVACHLSLFWSSSFLVIFIFGRLPIWVRLSSILDEVVLRFG